MSKQTFYVVYRCGRFNNVKEFNDFIDAWNFGEKHGGKVYREKEGVRFPDEDTEKDRTCVGHRYGQSANK